MTNTLTGERLYTHLEKKVIEAKLAGDMRESGHRQGMIRIMRRLKPELVARITQIPFLKRLDRMKLVPTTNRNGP